MRARFAPPANSATIAIPTITTNTLVSGDTAGFTESYSDNPNVGSTHVMAPAGTVNDNNGGANYKVTFVNEPRHQRDHPRAADY